MHIALRQPLALALLAAAGLAHGAGFTLSSPSIKPGSTLTQAQVFNGFGCTGQNISPELKWSGAPAGTKSFAITCFDPDAPTGSGYWHWIAFDIPASVGSMEAGAGNSETPLGGTAGVSDFGMNSYGGPCPPKGDGKHRYIFTVYALDVPALPYGSAKTTGATCNFLMRGHVLAKGSITGLFGH